MEAEGGLPNLTTLLLRRALFMTHPCSTESASMQIPIKELY